MKYKIGYIATISGLSTRTIRFYEQKGLLTPEKDVYTQYRYYNDWHITKLQQILLYKELGLSLEEIKDILSTVQSKDILPMLEKHLKDLEEKSNRLSIIKSTVKQTIKSLKGEITMSDQQKFEGLKHKLILDNEKTHKDEVIQKYGKSAYEQSKNQFKNMDKETFDHMNQLNDKLFDALASYKNKADEKVAKEIFNLHKDWITIAWGSYDAKKHMGVADLYVQDERFTKYYDQHGKGYSNILRNIIHKYAEHTK